MSERDCVYSQHPTQLNRKVLASRQRSDRNYGAARRHGPVIRSMCQLRRKWPSA